MELVDVRADAIAPGESICLGGSLILVTEVAAHDGVVDLFTEYGPALRFLQCDVVPVRWWASSVDAA